MCSVSTDLLAHVWMAPSAAANSSAPVAFPDFNTAHRCRNFDDVRAWAERAQVWTGAGRGPDGLVQAPRPEYVLTAVP